MHKKKPGFSVGVAVGRSELVVGVGRSELGVGVGKPELGVKK